MNKIKKLLITLLAGALLLTAAFAAGTATQVFADTASFTDVSDPGKAYYKPVYWAVENGITVGYKDGTFRPSAECTRSQFVTFIWRMAGKPTAKSAVKFSDVNSSMSAYRAIQWAVEQGIIVGYKDGTFRPQATVLRRQVAVMLWRWAGKPSGGSSNPFSDMDSSESSYRAVLWGSANGVIKGSKADGKQVFKPGDPCQRQQIVTFLYRYARDVQGKNVDIKEPEAPAAAEPVDVLNEVKADGDLVKLLNWNVARTKDGIYDYKNFADGDFTVIQNILQHPGKTLLWHDGYPTPIPEYGSKTDPLGKLTPGSAVCTADAEPVIWVAKNIYNLSDAAIEASKTTIIEGKEFTKPGEGAWGFYYYNGKYYQSTIVGATGDAPTITITKATLKNDYYYISYTRQFEYSDTVNTYYAVLKHKDIDGKKFWSIYTLCTDSSVGFVEP